LLSWIGFCASGGWANKRIPAIAGLQKLVLEYGEEWSDHMRISYSSKARGIWHSGKYSLRKKLPKVFSWLVLEAGETGCSGPCRTSEHQWFLKKPFRWWRKLTMSEQVIVVGTSNARLAGLWNFVEPTRDPFAVDWPYFAGKRFEPLVRILRRNFAGISGCQKRCGLPSCPDSEWCLGFRIKRPHWELLQRAVERTNLMVGRLDPGVWQHWTDPAGNS